MTRATVAHKVNQRWEPKARTRNETCRWVSYVEGKDVTCGAASHGKTYCKTCSERALAGPRSSKFSSVRSVRANH